MNTPLLLNPGPLPAAFSTDQREKIHKAVDFALLEIEEEWQKRVDGGLVSTDRPTEARMECLVVFPEKIRIVSAPIVDIR